MKLAVVGSRTFSNYDQLASVLLNQFPSVTEIVSGGAKGADSLAAKFAKENNLKLTVFPANWKCHGKAAGMIRNRDIINHSEAVLAFWDRKSSGTKNSIELARKANKRLSIVYFSTIKSMSI